MMTAKVQALGQEKIDGHQLLAETLLALRAPVVTDDSDLAKMKLAIVLQMNFQVEEGTDPLILSGVASTHSKQSKSFRDRWVDPRALAIVAEVIGEDADSAERYETFRSHRLDRN